MTICAACSKGLGLISIKKKGLWYCSPRCYDDYRKKCMQEVRVWQFLKSLHPEVPSTS